MKELAEQTSMTSELSRFIARNTDAIERNQMAIAHNTAAIQSNRAALRRLGVLMEDQKSKTEAMLEIVGHIDDKLNQQQTMATQLDDHEHRLAAIEQHLQSK